MSESDQTALWEQLKAAPTVPIPVVGLAADKLILAGPAIIMGLALQETGGSQTISFEMFDGSSASGEDCGWFRLTAGANLIADFTAEGFMVRRGLFVKANGTGTLTGAIYVKVLS